MFVTKLPKKKRSGVVGFIVQGSLVRAIRRLEELLVQLSAGLRSIGDMEMAEKVEKAAEKIKRDVIFAASLFL